MADPDDHGTSSTPAPTQWALLRIGFAVGAIGYAGAFQVINVLVLRFMADSLAISVGVGGTILALTKLYDAVADPLLGVASDKTHTRWGRRKPFLFAGAVALPLSMAMIFNVPDFSPTVLVVVICGLLILHGTAYSAFVVPYTAIGAEIDVGYHERSTLMSYRVYGGSLGLMCAASLAPWLASSWGSDRAAHGYMALILGGLTMACCLAAVWLIPEPPYSEALPTRVPFIKRARLVWDNRPFRMIIVAHIFFQIGVAAVSSSTAFFSRHILHTSDAWLGAFYLAKVVGNIVSVPMWLRIAKTYDKRTAYLLSLGAYGLLNLTWVFAGPEEPQVILFARMLLIGIAMGGCILLGYSVLADATRYDTVRTGLRREGSYSGVVSFVDKAAGALGVAFVGYLLSAMGYVAGNGTGADQSESARLAIYLAFAAIPGLSALASMAAMCFYTLRREDLETTA